MNKNKLLFYSALVLAIIICALLVIFRKSPPPTANSELANKQVSNETIAGQSSTTNMRPASVEKPTNGHPQSSTKLTYLEALKISIDAQNAPVTFFGRVVDQNTNGIAGVKVIFSVRRAKLDPVSNELRSDFPRFERTTDSEGRFSLENTSGDTVSIEAMQKDGYRLSPKTKLGFGTSSGSADDPVIFKMWKLGESQNLVSHNLTRIGIPVDGQSVQFDLFNGMKVSSGGELIVRVIRDPQSLPFGNSGYDWSAIFEIPNGGLVANNDEFMYQAPESGYQETYKIEMPKNATNWMATFDQQFYIQLEKGKCYGSLTVHLPTFHNTPPIPLSLGITINPSGSRYLQP